MGFLEPIVGVLSPLYVYYRNGGETCHWNWDEKISLMTIFRNLMDHSATQGIDMKYHLTELSCVCSCGSGCINDWTSLSDQSIKSFWEFNGFNYLFHLNDLRFTCIGWLSAWCSEEAFICSAVICCISMTSIYFEYLNWEITFCSIVKLLVLLFYAFISRVLTT